MIGNLLPFTCLTKCSPSCLEPRAKILNFIILHYDQVVSMPPYPSIECHQHRNLERVINITHNLILTQQSLYSISAISLFPCHLMYAFVIRFHLIWGARRWGPAFHSIFSAFLFTVHIVMAPIHTTQTHSYAVSNWFQQCLSNTLRHHMKPLPVSDVVSKMAY